MQNCAVPQFEQLPTIKPSVTRELKLAGDGERETERLAVYWSSEQSVCVWCDGRTDIQRDMLSEVDSTGLQASETYVSLTLNYVADRNLQLYSTGLFLRPNKTRHWPVEWPAALSEPRTLSSARRWDTMGNNSHPGIDACLRVNIYLQICPLLGFYVRNIPEGGRYHLQRGGSLQSSACPCLVQVKEWRWTEPHQRSPAKMSTDRHRNQTPGTVWGALVCTPHPFTSYTRSVDGRPSSDCARQLYIYRASTKFPYEIRLATFPV